jgi:hypothetical protein
MSFEEKLKELKTAHQTKLDSARQVADGWRDRSDQLEKQVIARDARIEELEKQVVDRDNAINLWRETLNKAHKDKNKIIDELYSRIEGLEKQVADRELECDNLEKACNECSGDSQGRIESLQITTDSLHRRVRALESAVKAEKTVVISDDVVRPTFSLDDEVTPMSKLGAVWVKIERCDKCPYSWQSTLVREGCKGPRVDDYPPASCPMRGPESEKITELQAEVERYRAIERARGCVCVGGTDE